MFFVDVQIVLYTMMMVGELELDMYYFHYSILYSNDGVVLLEVLLMVMMMVIAMMIERMMRMLMMMVGEDNDNDQEDNYELVLMNDVVMLDISLLLLISPVDNANTVYSSDYVSIIISYQYCAYASHEE
jgi:uncharacterized membrane protein